MKRYSILFIALIGIMGAISFINNSGYGVMIKSSDITAYALCGATIILVLKNLSKTSKINGNKMFFWISAVVVFYVMPYLKGYGMDGFRFLTYFLCTFVVSKLCFDEVNFRWLSICYGILTVIILGVCSFGDLLKGWNPNSLAIQAFQMLAIFCIGYDTDFKKKRLKKGILSANLSKIIFWVLVLYAAYLSDGFDCRSVSISCIILAILMFKNEGFGNLLHNKYIRIILVLIPCIVALVVLYSAELPFVADLDAWSRQQFRKPIFNGRDEIWSYGIKWLQANPLFGKGNINYGNWHNNAVGCLASFGLLGYFIFVKNLYNILSKASLYMNDIYVRKAVIVFFITYFQQSFENTLVQSGLMILHPYMMLGIILGRIAYLEYGNKSKYNSSGLQHR